MITDVAWPFLILQIANLLLLLTWIVLMVAAFWRMRRCQLGELAHIAWVALIVFVPLIGALAFLITRPGIPKQL